MNIEELPSRLAAALELTEAESGREFTDDEKSIFSVGFWAGAEMAAKYAIVEIEKQMVERAYALGTAQVSLGSPGCNQ